MPKIIVTSRYLKGGKKKISNYVKYIATREGSVPVTERENYVGYLANRPQSHGLFSQTDDPINLQKTAKEISEHKGNVWTHVISLWRDDAQQMGYDNLNAWRDLVRRQIPNIAKQQKIDMKNLKWYAAFHNKENNPHVHIVVYSTDEREGFLNNHGIEKIRSGFANDVYFDELHHLYEQQTDLRNLLKKQSQELMNRIANNISDSDFNDAELTYLISKLHSKLQSAKGKKVYGYLKADTKKTVDEIFCRLSQNESIQKMYSLWCEMEQQKHDVYSSAKIEFPELSDNIVFESVKNMIIKEVSEMHPALEFTDPELVDKSYSEVMLSEKKQSKVRQALTLIEGDDVEKGIAMLTECADSGNTFASYKLGKIYLDNNDLDKAEKYLLAAGENKYAQYALGKLYLKEEKYDAQKAVKYFKKCADENAWANYRLGILYLRGASNIERDTEKAVEYLSAASEQGSEYAQELLENMEQNEYEMIANTVMSLFANLSRCIADDYNQKFRSGRMSVDRKLRQMMSEKKQALGLKNEHNFE